jgi:DNA anti-recombination protein RmuC
MGGCASPGDARKERQQVAKHRESSNNVLLACSPIRHLYRVQFETYAKAKDEEAILAADERVRTLKAQLEEEYSQALEKSKRAIQDHVQSDANAKLRAVTRELFERVAQETDARLGVRDASSPCVFIVPMLGP